MSSWKQSDIDRLKNQGTKVQGWKAQPALPFPEAKKSGRKAEPRLPKISTNDLTKNAITFFKAKGFQCWRNSNIPIYDEKIGQYRSGSVLKGLPDILGYHLQSGVLLAVEIKNKHTKDKESVHQKVTLEAMRKAGCHVFVIRTMDDLK